MNRGVPELAAPVPAAAGYTTLKYTLFGVGFGACFPAVAIAIDLLLKAMPLTLASLQELFAANPIQLVVAQAPLVLGVSYYFIGRSRAALEHAFALREQTAAELRHRSTHDPLTGLPNRRRLAEALHASLVRLSREGGGFAVYLIDLDRFKPVNDLHGHAAGDQLLQGVAERLRTTVREADVVARLGGDEFAVVATTSGVDSVGDAARVGRRLIAAMEAPFKLNAGVALVGASIGIALAPVDGTDAERLLACADLAMYRAKNEGRGTFRFFETDMDLRIRERAALEVDLRAAILNDAIEPHFQPLFELASGRLISFEMLARWTHPTRGNVPPGAFIPVAEDTGLIVPMTERMLRRGCRIATTWPAEVILAVNISPLQLSDRALPGLVEDILIETGLAPGRLEIELTESALVGDFALALEILTDLKTLGVRLAIDDFGTGYSSLTHLQSLPFDTIKIDASFVHSMVEAPQSHKIVAAVIALGHTLGMMIIAEGIETTAQADALLALGCDIGQGWLFGRVLPQAEATSLAAANDLRRICSVRA